MTLEKQRSDVGAGGQTESGKRVSGRGDAEVSRNNILDIATEEFAANGLSGARVDTIAEKTLTSKRMIYYHFGSKEGLYLAVLERAYGGIRIVEGDLHLDEYSPEDAIRILIASTFDYQNDHPEFVRLVAIENIHNAEHLKTLPVIARLNASVIDTIQRILERGRTDGTFRSAIDATDLHMMISSFCFFRVSNRHTFSTIFERDLNDPATLLRHRQLIQDMIVTYLRNG